ncbi:hypothetical protein J6590_103663 [Homalodisca vitripennis]|nr:hypothetical protein J6590_103663 [Homalodisca vitripennis]
MMIVNLQTKRGRRGATKGEGGETSCMPEHAERDVYRLIPRLWTVVRTSEPLQTGPALPHVGQFQYTQYTRISPGGPWTGIENVIAAIFKHGSL